MPKKLGPKVAEWCVQPMLDDVTEDLHPPAAVQVVAERNRVGTDSVRRW